jgi:hypothetical protein
MLDMCEMCGDDYGELLDGLCRKCNPESHAWADKEEAEELETELWKQ